MSTIWVSSTQNSAIKPRFHTHFQHKIPMPDINETMRTMRKRNLLWYRTLDDKHVAV
jgi:hypothetical protein